MRLSLIIIALISLLAIITFTYITVFCQSIPADTVATYVGRQSCIQCHPTESRTFLASQHDEAMQVATEQTVLGRFDNQLLQESGQSARFYRDQERFMVETQGESGDVANFEIGWTFGVKPLQQYMVSMSDTHIETLPIGRVQVLRWCWDTENQRWFHLDPPDVHGTLAPEDELHWTGPSQRWNNMCAECHSTNLQKNFVVADRKFHSTFAEIDVSCEACHGPASIHLTVADKWFYRKDKNFGHGINSLKLDAEQQIQACAPCHSRRGELAEGYKPGDEYADYFSESLLSEGLYFNDGQVLDEDYVHGSFIQSKMYHKGIKCTDCHDPHTAKLRHSGNEICTSCHQHPQVKYDTPSHHFHKSGTAAAMCVNCHMSATTYMEVDARRDHSFRIPRPDLSVSLGTPNACTGCHLHKENLPEAKRDQLTQYLDWMNAVRSGDAEIAAEIAKVDKWCDEACEKWYGADRKTPYHFATALTAARREQSNAPKLLQELLRKRGEEAPAIARATALREILIIDPQSAAQEAKRLLGDPSPLVRAAATTALQGESNLEQRYLLLKKMFSDPTRLVRIEAARMAVSLYPNIRAFDQADAQNALDELRRSLLMGSDRGAAHLVLGSIEEQLGNTFAAIESYETAIEVEGSITGPRTNLASLLDQLSANPSTASANVEKLRSRAEQLRREEIPLLQRDLGYAPNNAAIANRLGLTYYSLGQNDESLRYLLRATKLEPKSADYSVALVLLLQKLNRLDEAKAELARIFAIHPNDPQLQMIKL